MPSSFGNSTLGGYDSIPQQITQKALLNNQSLEEKQRREEALKNKDFYYGRQEQEVFLMNIDVQPLTVNLTRPVVSKRASMLYSRPLVRHFMGTDASVKFLEQVYKDNRIDQFMLKVDLHAELTGSALVHPYADPNLPGGFRLRMYDGTQFSATGKDDDPSTADAISLVRVIDRITNPGSQIAKGVGPQVERVLQQQVWTNKDVTFYEGDIPVATEKNPLGFIPFVNVKGEEVHDQFVGFPPAQSVRKLNSHINQKLTELGYTLTMQAGAIVVLQGFNSGESVTLHPGRALNVPNGGGADVLNFDPSIQETLDVIKYMEDRLYTTSGVPEITVIGGQEGSMGRNASGRELLVRWFPLLQVFTEKSTRYNQYELELANMILAVAGYDPIEDVKVEWPEESLLPLSAEEETLLQDIQLSIKTPIDEILRRNPRLTSDEAAEIFVANREINSTIETQTNQAEVAAQEQVKQNAIEDALASVDEQDLKENYNDGKS